jgi:hypothetical protein
MSCRPLLVATLATFTLAACSKSGRSTTPREMPLPSVQVGACGRPGVDGVLGKSPKLERWDRDLDGDGVAEYVVVDRGMCADDNCYWNVFRPPPAGSTECSRYAGTFAGAALEPLPGAGEDHMRDIRGYWHLHGGRMLLQSYRFMRGGYQLVDALLCRRAADDKLECSDSDR